MSIIVYRHPVHGKVTRWFMYLFRKIIFFLSIALTIIIIREFISLYSDLRGIDAYLGYAFLIFMGVVFIYFVIIPLIKVLLLPGSFAPVNHIDEREKIMEKRLARFKKNKY
ncbi:MAG: hypothetical protein GF313_01660, partial [Caldithrix sp.]|nr:hypothetical protein [Caldithrix sp.]